MSDYLDQVGLGACLWELPPVLSASYLHGEMKAQPIVSGAVL